MLKEIAQITWINYLNFGSILQAYALQQALGALGFRSRIIDDKSFVKLKGVRNHLGFIKSLLLRPVWHYYNHVKYRRYRNFIEEYIYVDYSWINEQDLLARYDTFICGSDQIWSSLLPNHHDGFYFASFVPEDNYLKIAYAPSIGSKQFDDRYAEMAKPWMQSFKALSSREQAGAEIISKITGRDDVEVVIDPTLLLPSSHWEALLADKAHGTEPKKKSLVAYFLTYNEEYLAVSKQIAAAKGLDLVIIGQDERMKKYAQTYLPALGPLEFLNAMARAEYVITDSFHGTIFAIHFKRPFITVKRFKEGQNNNQNSRIENLFNILGITDNLLGVDELKAAYETSDYPEIPEWGKIEAEIERSRRASQKFIKRNLELKWR